MKDSIMFTAKATAYVVVWLCCAMVLVRYVVGPLLGSGTDLGLVATPFAAVASILGLAKLASVMLGDLDKSRNPEPKDLNDE